MKPRTSEELSGQHSGIERQFAEMAAVGNAGKCNVGCGAFRPHSLHGYSSQGDEPPNGAVAHYANDTLGDAGNSKIQLTDTTQRICL